MEKRVFESGASRNSDEDKLDYEGFLNPAVMKIYAEYMHSHRMMEDGSMRESDNWQKGIPVDQYMKSLYRHFQDLHLNHRGYESEQNSTDSLCAIIFNAMGLLLETEVKGNL